MNNKTKAYMDLYLKIRNDIIHGIYQTGDKLPSKRNLADKENVSVITVAHAYELLTSEGYITSRMRSGYFVSYLEKDFFSAKEDSNIEIFQCICDGCTQSIKYATRCITDKVTMEWFVIST